jgi:2-oxoglutarate dehydrogenase E2 component (dihydrolipoamide succinyltransferase)
MSTAVKMPQLGESVVEGTVARWLKRVGDPVVKREPLLEISTDKIDTEVPAPADGTLLEIVVPEGTTVRAGTTLATIGDATAQVAAEAPGAEQALPSGEGEQAADGEQTYRQNIADAPPAGRNFVSPVVARMAAEHQLNLADVPGTGLGGRVTKRDVEAYLAQQGAATTNGEASISDRVPDRTAHVEAAAEDEPPVRAGSAAAELQPDEFLTPLTAMRRAIAQHMLVSKRTSPHVTSIFEADMTAVVRHRENHKATYAAKGIGLTYTPYFVAAIVAGLKAVPEVNSRFTDEGIVVNRRMHIGVAVALGQGLIVPVIRDADEKNLQGLARSVNELVERSRNGRLLPEEIQGGTFTLTNHGTGGSLFATPIINQPQTAILGAGAITKRPVVRSSSQSLLPSADDSIVIRPICFLSLTFDHRVLDGAQADAFLTAVTRRLENWD